MPRSWLSLGLVMAVALGGTAAAWATPFAYVPNYTGGTVSVIDAATNTVTATIPAYNPPVNSRMLYH